MFSFDIKANKWMKLDPMNDAMFKHNLVYFDHKLWSVSDGAVNVYTFSEQKWNCGPPIKNYLTHSILSAVAY